MWIADGTEWSMQMERVCECLTVPVVRFPVGS